MKKKSEYTHLEADTKKYVVLCTLPILVTHLYLQSGSFILIPGVCCRIKIHFASGTTVCQFNKQNKTAQEKVILSLQKSYAIMLCVRRGTDIE